MKLQMPFVNSFLNFMMASYLIVERMKFDFSRPRKKLELRPFLP